jgi:hypothetical protein
MNVRSLRLVLDDYTDISIDLTILSWILMTGYCISGIFRKSLRPSFASKPLTLAQPVSIHGGGRHMWEVTSDEVTSFLKVCTFLIYTSVPPTATDGRMHRQDMPQHSSTLP